MRRGWNAASRTEALCRGPPDRRRKDGRVVAEIDPVPEGGRPAPRLPSSLPKIWQATCSESELLQGERSSLGLRDHALGDGGCRREVTIT